jgi:regulator of RNase E activity RraA
MTFPTHDVLTGEPLAPLADGTLDLLKKAGVAGVVTELFKRGLRETVIAGALPLRPGTVMAGEAFTVRAIPMRPDIGTPDFMVKLPRNLQRMAITEVGPGQVLCVDARGDMRAGFMGDILATSLAQRGVAGVVTDGGLRDADGIAETGLPAFCAGPAPAGSQAHLHVVDLNVPICCGGRPVFPGDVLLGGGDGVVVIPRAMAAEVAEAAAAQADLEAFCLARIKDGAPLIGTYPPNEETLAAYRASKG